MGRRQRCEAVSTAIRMDSKTVEIWHSQCSHCKYTTTKYGPLRIEVTLNSAGKILNIDVSCDNKQEGQDRT